MYIQKKSNVIYDKKNPSHASKKKTLHKKRVAQITSSADQIKIG